MDHGRAETARIDFRKGERPWLQMIRFSVQFCPSLIAGAISFTTGFSPLIGGRKIFDEPF
jgi:hypothetical protein